MRIFYSEIAAQQLESLDRVVQIRVTSKLAFFATQKNYLSFAKRLSGQDVYRFRVGDYRVVFEIDGPLIVILLVLKRSEVYRSLD